MPDRVPHRLAEHAGGAQHAPAAAGPDQHGRDRQRHAERRDAGGERGQRQRLALQRVDAAGHGDRAAGRSSTSGPGRSAACAPRCAPPRPERRSAHRVRAAPPTPAVGSRRVAAAPPSVIWVALAQARAAPTPGRRPATAARCSRRRRAARTRRRRRPSAGRRRARGLSASANAWSGPPRTTTAMTTAAAAAAGRAARRASARKSRCSEREVLGGHAPSIRTEGPLRIGDITRLWCGEPYRYSRDFGRTCWKPKRPLMQRLPRVMS